MGRIALFSWLITLGFCYFLLGGYLGHLIEGYDASRLSLLPLGITGAALLASLILTVQWAKSTSPSKPTPSARRSFLFGSLGAAGGILSGVFAALAKNRRWYSVTGQNIFMVKPPYASNQYDSKWNGARIENYRRLGRTDCLVSDISLGTGSSTGGRLTPAVAREAIDRGMNYFDTAPDYASSGSEQVLGEAIQGVRDQIFLATKFCTPRGHLGPGTSVDDYMKAVDGSLSRLNTDHVDLVHIHSCDTIDRLLDENAHEAFDRLKEQGKVRFLGVSTHTPDLETIASAAIESDRFDVMMLAYHYGAWPEIGNLIDRASEKDIGVVAMKTLRGGLHKGLLDIDQSPDSFTQASFKWVLSNPSVSCLVISLWQQAQIDEFFYASGSELNRNDYAVLEKYEKLTRETQCRPHCGACLSSCPEELAIDDILRHRSYFENFGAEKEAMNLYANLQKKADACITCDAPCQTACPSGIDIPKRTRGAHALLNFG